MKSYKVYRKDVSAVRQLKHEDILALEPNKAADVDYLLFGPTYYEIQT